MHICIYAIIPGELASSFKLYTMFYHPSFKHLPFFFRKYTFKHLTLCYFHDDFVDRQINSDKSHNDVDFLRYEPCLHDLMLTLGHISTSCKTDMNPWLWNESFKSGAKLRDRQHRTSSRAIKTNKRDWGIKCGTYVVYMVQEPVIIMWRGVPSMLSGGYLWSERSRLVFFSKKSLEDPV